MSNSSVSIKFRCGLSTSDPEEHPVLFVGQGPHLSSLAWSDVRCKLEPRVSEEVWRRAVRCASGAGASGGGGGGGGGGGEVVEAWPRGAAVASLPARRSRHAPPARPHHLTKIVKAQASNVHHIVLVCRKRDALASCVAAARAFPLYSARSGSAPLGAAPPPAAPPAVSVEMLLVPEDKADGDVSEEGVGPLEPALADGALAPAELATIQHVAHYTRLAASIADTPANIMTVDRFIEIACEIAKELDIDPPTIIRGEELRERGMGGLYGVGQAAVCPPALVALSYTPPGATGVTPNVAWVGKGIVYDTGGLSIKARTSMVGMKGDCAGAAGVLCAFAAAVRALPTVRLHAVLCLAENAVGPKATRPDDIHQLYSGRTVEINNTDAEGRLVLSDGVVYAHRDLKADTIVDMATLTGAQGIATGKYHAALVSNSGRLERRCVSAGLRCGEPAHALPFAPELHFPELSSAVADMKNSVADRNNAQPSCAGLFILAHLGFDFRGAWLHIDMAAPATMGERATGYGVSLLCTLFGAHTQSRLLRALSAGPVVSDT